MLDGYNEHLSDISLKVPKLPDPTFWHEDIIDVLDGNITFVLRQLHKYGASLPELVKEEVVEALYEALTVADKLQEVKKHV